MSQPASNIVSANIALHNSDATSNVDGTAPVATADTGGDETTIIPQQQQSGVAMEDVKKEEEPTRHETPEELFRKLQHMEIACYATLLRVFRAQGELSWAKSKILEDLRALLHISPQRHRAELMRAEQDDLLQRIASRSTDIAQLRLAYREQTEESVDTAEQTRLAEGVLPLMGWDTESEPEDNLQRHKTPRRKTARRQHQTTVEAEADSATPKKRGRKRKEPEDGTTAAGRMPRRGKVGRPPKEKVDLQTAAAVDNILAQSDNREVTSLNIEDVEVVATLEQQQIDMLDKLLNQTDDQAQKQRIMSEVQRKKDKLIRLIEHLESLC